MLRVGLVGCGFIGRVHSWALWALAKAGLTEARLTRVLDPDAERAAKLAEPHGAEVAGALQPLLDAVDAVWVCTPTATHLGIVEAAAGRGVAVFCEKPLAPSYPAARQVATILNEVPHQVGLVLRTAPVFGKVADAIHSQRHGPAMTLVLRDDQYLPNQGQYASAWRVEVAAAGGGTLIEHSIHDLDLFRWLFGDPDAVACTTSSFSGHPGIEDLATVGCRYPDGRMATLVSVWHQVLSRPSTRRLEVFFEDAVMWTDDDNTGPLHVQTASGVEVVECPPEPWVDELGVPEHLRRPLGLYAMADKRFCDDLGAGRTPWPDADDALAAHALVDAAYRSASEEGSAVVP